MSREISPSERFAYSRFITEAQDNSPWYQNARDLFLALLAHGPICVHQAELALELGISTIQLAVLRRLLRDEKRIQESRREGLVATMLVEADAPTFATGQWANIAARADGDALQLLSRATAALRRRGQPGSA